MQTISKTKKELSSGVIQYQKFAHIYKTAEGLWRGFVAPYDVTYEAKTKKKVEEILPKLVALYEEGLEKYKYPKHLTSVALSDKEDRNEFFRWTKSVM